MTPYHEYMLSFFITILITKLIFSIVLFLGDVGRLFYGVGNAIAHQGEKTTEPLFSIPPEIYKRAGYIDSSIPRLPGLFMLWLGGNMIYKVHHETIYFDDLPEAFDGFTITQISDIHSGSFDNTAAVQRGIDSG